MDAAAAYPKISDGRQITKELLSTIGTSGGSSSTKGHKMQASNDNKTGGNIISKIRFFQSKKAKDALLNIQGKIIFCREVVAGNGNCALEAMRIERKILVETLLPLSEDEASRKKLWKEIHDAFTASESGLKPPDEMEWMTICGNVNKHQQELDDKRRALFEKLPEADQFGEDFEGLITWLNKEGQEHWVNDLQSQKAAIDAAESQVKDYCMQKDVFEYYVKSLEDFRCKVWIGAKSLLLFANAKQFTLYIWSLEDIEDSTSPLLLLHCYCNESTETVFHLLYTGNHFDRLIELPKSDNKSIQDQTSLLSFGQ